jgi:hypothetical protein
MMSWGLYPGQMHWFLTQFAREQMLLLSVHTDSSDADPNVFLQTVLDFLGIPAVARLPEVDGFSHSNHADASQAEDILDCDLHALLTEFFLPYNDIFYAMEPEFEPFPPTSDVPCKGTRVLLMD